MTKTIFPSVHSGLVDADNDCVRFTVTIKTDDDRIWNYRGVVTGTALAVIGGDRDPLEIFNEHRREIAEKAVHAWSEQPESFRYELDSSNVRQYGVFVNNG